MGIDPGAVTLDSARIATVTEALNEAARGLMGTVGALDAAAAKLRTTGDNTDPHASNKNAECHVDKEERLLAALGRLGVRREEAWEVAVEAGLANDPPGVRAALGALRELGLAHVQEGRWSITPAGCARLGIVPPRPRAR